MDLLRRRSIRCHVPTGWHNYALIYKYIWYSGPSRWYVFDRLLSKQAVVLAHWSGQGQAWIRNDDPLRRALHQVTGWRPAK